MRLMIALALGVFAIACGEITFADADPSATDSSNQSAPGSAQIRRDEETQAWMAREIEKTKTQNADRAAAQRRYEQSVESAKAEHRVALDKCESRTDEPQKSCKERADAEFAAAKSAAESALEAHTSAQP